MSKLEVTVTRKNLSKMTCGKNLEKNNADLKGNHHLASGSMGNGNCGFIQVEKK